MPKKPSATNYITNPFFIGLEGLKNLYARAAGVFWLLLVLSIIFAMPNFSNDASEQDKNFSGGDATAILIFVAVAVIAFIIVGIVIWGMAGYAAYRTGQGEKASLKESFNAGLNSFWRLLAVFVIMVIRIIGWALLLLIPGLIMSVRYSLANVVAFAEPKLKAGEVVSKSASLTKNAWFDTFAGQTLFSLITLGLIDYLVQTGSSSVLYRQLADLKASGAEKPKTHWLSYLTLAIPLAVVALIVFIVVLFAVSFGNNPQ